MLNWSWSTAVAVASASCSCPPRTAVSRLSLSAPRSWSVSSCSSRAQRLRSASDARIEWRSRSDSTDCAVAIAIAALAPNEARRCSSSPSNTGDPCDLSSATSAPRARPRKPSGTTSAEVAPAQIGSSPCPSRSARLGTRTGAPVPDDRARQGPLERQCCAERVAPDLPGARDHPQDGALLEQDEQRARVDQRAPALDDQLEHPVQVRLEADRARDRGRRLQAADRSLELDAPARLGFVQAGVVDRDRRPFREDQRRLLVALVELGSAGLVRQVEVAERLAADADRHSQERLHRRMPRREAVRALVLGHVRQPQRLSGCGSARRGPRGRGAAGRSSASSPRRSRRTRSARARACARRGSRERRSAPASARARSRGSGAAPPRRRAPRPARARPPAGGGAGPRSAAARLCPSAQPHAKAIRSSGIEQSVFERPAHELRAPGQTQPSLNPGAVLLDRPDADRQTLSDSAFVWPRATSRTTSRSRSVRPSPSRRRSNAVKPSGRRAAPSVPARLRAGARSRFRATRAAARGWRRGRHDGRARRPARARSAAGRGVPPRRLPACARWPTICTAPFAVRELRRHTGPP